MLRQLICAQHWLLVPMTSTTLDYRSLGLAPGVSACHGARVHFSSRFPKDLEPSELASALSSGPAVVDLTETNPTRVGLIYDKQEILSSLSSQRAFEYDPQPLGLRTAREAVVAYLHALGRTVPVECVALTASTSEAYSILFKLLCDPGGKIAMPAPSYPLVQHLAALEAMRGISYRLYYDDGWKVDLDSLRHALKKGAEVVVVISPNNPTGSVLGAEVYAQVEEACAQYGAAVIIDEVFAPYGAAGAPVAPLATASGPLTFVLDGLSKCAALPQLKLGWIEIYGARNEVDQALVRLEWLLDAYLSVSTPVQVAAPVLLAAAPAMQQQIRTRVEQNRRLLASVMASANEMHLLVSDGGWQAVLRLPQGVDEEELVARLATGSRVLTHPGYFYDFEDDGHLVLSLIVEPSRFALGAQALARAV